MTGTAGPGRADGPGRLDPASLPQGRTPVRLFRRTCSEQWKVSLGLWRWLRGHAGDYDVVHVHGVWSFATSAACAGTAPSAAIVTIAATSAVVVRTRIRRPAPHARATRCGVLAPSCVADHAM